MFGDDIATAHGNLKVHQRGWLQRQQQSAPSRLTRRLFWGKTIIWLCVRDYIGVRGFWWLKRLLCHRNDLSIWCWILVGPDIWLFGCQTANIKCIEPDLPVKWAVLFLIFFLGNWWINLHIPAFFPARALPLFWRKTVWTDFFFLWPRKIKPWIEKSIFCWFSYFEPSF